MQPPKNAWDLHLYQHIEHQDVTVVEHTFDTIEDDGYALLGTCMYAQPLVEDGELVGTRYVFAMCEGEGTIHYDIRHHASSRTSITLHPEPAVRADYDVSDADRDADARRAQAADEAHAERMR